MLLCQEISQENLKTMMQVFYRLCKHYESSRIYCAVLMIPSFSNILLLESLIQKNFFHEPIPFGSIFYTIEYCHV